MKKFLLLSVLAGALPLTAAAQDDDLYFNDSDDKVEAQSTQQRRPVARRPVVGPQGQTYHSGSNRDVDEYNRRGRSYYEYVGTDDQGSDIIEFQAGDGKYEIDSTKTKRYYGDAPQYDDSEDYTISRRLGMYDDWYGWYSPYYSRYWYGWYDPWWYGRWYDPWYYSWYDPWYYGGWYGGRWGWGWHGWYGGWYGGWRPGWYAGTVWHGGYGGRFGGIHGTRNHGGISRSMAAGARGYSRGSGRIGSRSGLSTRSLGRSGSYGRSSSIGRSRSYNNGTSTFGGSRTRSYSGGTRSSGSFGRSGSFSGGSRGGSFGGGRSGGFSGGGSRGGGGSFGAGRGGGRR